MADATQEENASYLAALARSNKVEQQLALTPEKFRILTGDRPTGDLHLGHYFGSIKNRVKLQNLGVSTMILIADMQVITDRDEPGAVRDSVYSILADQLACGIDPEITPFFTHSSVSALNELALLFLSLVTDSELRRNPTVKAELAASNRPMSGLMLTYPVHQAADILFSTANLVPGGRDQLPHIQIARIIAQRFNARYESLFVQPDLLLSSVPKLLGLDGEKMSKSRGNTIKISDTPETTTKAIKRAITDADPQITYDPVSRPGVANLLTITAACLNTSPEELLKTHSLYGARELKELTIGTVNEAFQAIRERRAELIKDIPYLRGILLTGNRQANEIAETKLALVRTAMGFSY